MSGENHSDRLKRLRMRSWRRGIKEMDLILGKFADSRLDGLQVDQLDAYELLLETDDHTLYAMFSKQIEDAPHFKNILNSIRDLHNIAET